MTSQPTQAGRSCDRGCPSAVARSHTPPGGLVEAVVEHVQRSSPSCCGWPGRGEDVAIHMSPGWSPMAMPWRVVALRGASSCWSKIVALGADSGGQAASIAAACAAADSGPDVVRAGLAPLAVPLVGAGVPALGARDVAVQSHHARSSTPTPFRTCSTGEQVRP